MILPGLPSRSWPEAAEGIRGLWAERDWLRTYRRLLADTEALTPRDEKLFAIISREIGLEGTGGWNLNALPDWWRPWVLDERARRWPGRQDGARL